MVAETTEAKKQPMIFLTAPPEIKQTAGSRFRVPRNLPYRDAPTYQSSIYYWWWAFLKRNLRYADTCANQGRGRSAKLYKDFGNVFESDFLTWWRCHQGLFAEQSSAGKYKPSCNQESGIWYQIDPSRPFNQIHEEIKALHLEAHAIVSKKKSLTSSTAKYPVYANVSAHTLHRVLAIWDLRSGHPKASAYELGITAGYKANLIPTSKFGETRTRPALDAQAHNKRVRVSIANQANRYLRIAAQYIENVGHGEFPKAANR